MHLDPSITVRHVLCWDLRQPGCRDFCIPQVAVWHTLYVYDASFLDMHNLLNLMILTTQHSTAKDTLTGKRSARPDGVRGTFVYTLHLSRMTERLPQCQAIADRGSRAVAHVYISGPIVCVQ